MNKEQIDSILKELGISFNKKKILLDGEVITDNMANKLLASKNTTLEEVRNVLAEAAKKPIEIPDNLRFRDHLSYMEVISPAFTTHTKWNSIDEELFGFFFLARSSEGGGMLLLISNKDTEFMTVTLSANKLTNLAEITSTCSRMHYVDPETHVKRTLFEHINKVYEKIMSEALAAYKKMDAVDFGEWAVRHGLPSVMLNNNKLMSTQEEIECDNGDGGKTTMYKPHSLFFPSTPLECIAEHYDNLAGVPKRLAKIPRLYSNDMNEPALYHIDLDAILDYDNPHPTWEHYLLRFREDERRVLRAFIWSIFDAGNTGRQMLYIYDPDGFSGKSVLTKAIAFGLGEHLVTALQKDSLNNQFSMSKIWNKRLTVIDDNKNPNLLRSEKIHIVLGNGLADVEEKGKKSFMYKIQCKVIASGNVQLNIDPYANHERTRVIVIEPKLTDEMLKEFVVCDKDGNIVRNRQGKPQFIGDSTFEQRLIDEFRSFLVDCKRDYEELCPKRSSIIISEAMDDSIEYLSDDYYDVLDEQLPHFFEVDPNNCMSISDFNKDLTRLMDNPMLLKCTDDNEPPSREHVIQHIVKRYHVKKGGRRLDGEYVKCYIGIASARKSATENNKVVSVDSVGRSPVVDPWEMFDDAG